MSEVINLKDLSAAPQDLESTLQRLFAGTTPERIEAAIAIVDWVIPRLEGNTACTALSAACGIPGHPVV